jgi:hypothetical protein
LGSQHQLDLEGFDGEFPIPALLGVQALGVEALESFKHGLST